MLPRVASPMFGLSVTAPFNLAGIPAETAAPGPGRPFALRLTPRADILAHRPSDGCERLSDMRDPAGRSLIRVDRHPKAGTFMMLRGQGAFRIAADARSADLAPIPRAAWRWQRVLIGQVLPFAALLNGLEVLHASAVEIGGSAVAIVGGSHAGKSTLAAHWVAGGATLVADDVVALEPTTAGPPTVHPGPPLLSVREGTRKLMGNDAIDRLGRTIGADDAGARIAVDNHRTDPLPLGGLVLVRRDDGRRRLDVRLQDAPDPRLILGSTFNLVVRAPERLTTHLDLAARIFATVPVVVADVGSGSGPDVIARAVERELGAGG